jgi:predicted transcriptional regulator
MITEKKRQQPIENKIYASIIGVCEGREKSGSYRGNGHHLARELTFKVSEALLARQQRKIYDAMSNTPMTSKDIGEKCGLSSKVVSAQIKRINDTTLLVSSKRDGRFKMWYKYNG